MEVLMAIQRQRVADASRRLAEEGLVLGTAGNVSERDGDHIAITPTGARLAELAAGDVAVVDRAGAHVEGELAATSELALHLAIYDRYEAGAVVHAHPPMATALSCVLEELPLVHHGMVAFASELATAVDNTLLLEWACEVYWRAAAIGTPKTLGAEEQQAVLETVAKRAYGTTQKVSG
jgi:L-fuculose-phosphate aldolase